MSILGFLFLSVGIILALASGIGIVMAAFRESPLWGIGCIFVPIVSFVFIVLHWAETKKFFFMNLAGLGGILLGSLCMKAGRS